MKLCVAGGRDHKLSDQELCQLSALFLALKVTEVVHGGAAGVDAEVAEMGERAGLVVTCFEADWAKYGRKAGPLRNAQMAAYADAVVLFPGGKGTDSMYREAKRAGKEIFDWRNKNDCVQA